MPAQVNITVENDADFYQVFQYTQPDGQTPVNLLGTTFKMGIRRTVGDAGILFNVTSMPSAAGAITLVNPQQGLFALWIAQPQLLLTPIGTWFHSLIASVPATEGIPPLALQVFGGTLTITDGPSR